MGESGDDVERALAENLGPWLYHRLATEGTLAQLTPPLQARLRQSHLAAAGRNLLILQAMEELLPSLPGLRMVLLKGLALLPLYPGPGARPLSDVDVLIARRDLPATRQRLVALGYRAEPVHGEAYDCEFHSGLAFSRDGGDSGIRLDLHWDLVGLEWFPDTGLPDFEEVWTRSLPGPFPEDLVRVLCPEDTLLHLCLHVALHHSFECRLSYVDIALLLDRAASKLDWDLFRSLVRRSGWGPAVYFALESAGGPAGARVPEGVLRRLRPARGRLWLIRRLVGRGPRVGHQASRLLQLALAEKPGHALAMAGSALFPSEKWLRLRYSAGPERGAAALRLLHGLRLVGLLRKALGQLLSR